MIKLLVEQVEQVEPGVQQLVFVELIEPVVLVQPQVLRVQLALAGWRLRKALRVPD